MDGAVNHGPGAAAVMLQRAVGARRDGLVGPETARAANAGDPWPVTRRVLVERGHLYRLLTIRHPDQEAFFDGWLGRLFDLEALSLRGPVA
jgi:lysozyme family protein